MGPNVRVDGAGPKADGGPIVASVRAPRAPRASSASTSPGLELPPTDATGLLEPPALARDDGLF